MAVYSVRCRGLPRLAGKQLLFSEIYLVEEVTMNLLLFILLLVLLFGALPSWPYSRNWGYYPSGTLGVILIVLLILMLL